MGGERGSSDRSPLESRTVRHTRVLATAAMGACLLLGGSALASPSAAPHRSPGLRHAVANRDAKPHAASGTGVFVPAPPCPLPQTSLVPSKVPVVGGTTVGPCVKAPEFPATGAPEMGNMTYWGGRVQVHPHIYLVYFGWGQEGAFKADCTPVQLREGRFTARLGCDPDGAGKRMADFVQQLGGTEWAQSQTQYYQVVNGVKTYIHNDKDQLAGIWADDAHHASAKITYRDMATEAERAVAHFHIPASQLMDSNVVILQPQNFSDPVAQADGYCAFHDLVRGDVDPKDYKGLAPDLPWTNMPYVLNQGSGCGQNLVNAGARGKLDGFTIALGHEIEETVTDPGAEDVIGHTPIGGWFDPFDGNENGDKCAYVGDDLTGAYAFFAGGADSLPVPGAGADIRGNAGGSFPVQSLWSNSSAGGVGYCAGAGTDVPVTG